MPSQLALSSEPKGGTEGHFWGRSSLSSSSSHRGRRRRPSIMCSNKHNPLISASSVFRSVERKVIKCDSRMQILNNAALIPLIVSILLFSASCVECVVKIHGMRVPKHVENGTERSVVLDCIYTLDPEEDLNLVVKWFLNEDPEPIYQWIAELDTIHVPQRYEGRVNTNYRVPPSKVPPSGYRYQKRRALNLIRPTVEFNGKYACHVMSLHSQASSEANMIIFAKTKRINLQTRRVVRERSTALQQTTGSDSHHRSPNSPSPDSSGSAALSSNSWLYGESKNTVPTPPRLSSASATEVQCSVENVYPVPELTIYQVRNDGASPRSLQNARYTQNVTRMPNGAFGVTLTAFVEDAELLKNAGTLDGPTHVKYHPARKAGSNRANSPNNQATIFECLVSQEEIHHEVRNRTIYLPLKDENDFDSSAAVSYLSSTGISALLSLCLAVSVLGRIL